MLSALSIRDLVLIDRLDLDFGSGLSVLTGETGAGKSILLDALGLALGGRGGAGLVRPGAKRAHVSAVFEPPAGHPAFAMLEENGLEAEDGLILRRQIDPDGRGRAFVNDRPVGVTLLRDLGASLAEIQGQFDQHGLIDGTTHLGLLDAHAGLAADAAAVATAWSAWRAARGALERAEAEIETARRDEDFLRHAVSEIEALDPRPGEAARLAEERALTMNREKIADAVTAALAFLDGGEGEASGRSAEAALQGAQAQLSRVSEAARGRLDPALAALAAALAEAGEAAGQLRALAEALQLDQGRQDQVEERLFTMRQLARKHEVTEDDLAAHGMRLASRLAALEDQDRATGQLRAAADAAQRDYRTRAERLGAARRRAAEALDRAIMEELPALKLEKARFVTAVETLPEGRWGPRGQDAVLFTVAANPGARPGPLGKVASGGELSRILLALKVVLASADPIPTLIFDEVDSGVGGATAAAVGDRLARLATHPQVLVVTHSPQVAAVGTAHWRVEKLAVEGGGAVRTVVTELDGEARREEIARMISGAAITEEARAAARRLLQEAATVHGRAHAAPAADLFAARG